jgi:hypothetical protein
MLYGKIIAAFSQIYTKHIKTLCGQNANFYVKLGGTYSDHLKGWHNEHGNKLPDSLEGNSNKSFKSGVVGDILKAWWTLWIYYPTFRALCLVNGVVA